MQRWIAYPPHGGKGVEIPHEDKRNICYTPMGISNAEGKPLFAVTMNLGPGYGLTHAQDIEGLTSAEIEAICVRYEKQYNVVPRKWNARK